MKKALFLCLIYFVTANDKKVYIESFSLNDFSYNIYSEQKYLHDDNVHAEFFTVYLKGKKTSLCSSFKSALRNDTLFTKGVYLHTNKNIIFKEYYYQNQSKQQMDSMVKIFYPNKIGNLILKSYTTFRNGKAVKD